MNNNDVFRRVRYIFNFKDAKTMELFELAGYTLEKDLVLAWLKQDDDEGYKVMNDQAIAAFLNGLIIEKRGKKDDKEIVNEKRMNNNIVFRKLKIALSYRDEDIIDIFKLVDLRVSKHEISALFRGQTQKQYRPCKDQFLRNFLLGLQMKFRSKEEV